MMIDKEFLKGCDLWVAPDITDSPWRWTIEWSLNFQVAKSLAHRSETLSPEFKALLRQTESEEFEVDAAVDSPWTMVAAHHVLPARWFLMSGPLSKEQFQRTLDDAWTKLGEPATRIFASKSWTKDMIEGLKSKCVKDPRTEVFAHEPKKVESRKN